MLAYLFWHRPVDGVQPEAYEQAAARFHRSLAHAPPAGFRGSALYRADRLPWLSTATSDADDAGGYEDWYLVEDFAALGVLNEAAVAHGHRTAHDEVARRMGRAAGGLYALLEGTVSLARERVVVWVGRPPGETPPTFADLLGDGMDAQQTALLRRALVLGPAPEYCVLGAEPPAGVRPTRLPAGWTATVCARAAVASEPGTGGV